MRKIQYTMFERALCFVLCAFSFLWPSGVSAHPNKDSKVTIPEKEINELSQAIKAAPIYREDLRRILDLAEDSLANADDDRQRCLISLNLAQRFRPVNTDSSLYYAIKATTLAENLDSNLKHRSSIAVINALATAGLFTEALNQLESIHESILAPSTRLEYWIAGRRLFGYMKGYAQGNTVFYTKYEKRYQEFDDSLIMHLPSDDRFKIFLECERLVTNRHFQEAKERLENLLAKLPQESNLYGMATFQLAEVWRNLGNEERYASMLALSALSDVKGCVTEGLALPTLAEWLYDRGILGESFSFINFALEEASGGNARMRAVTIARFVPLIDDSYNEKIKSSRDELMIYFLLVTILLIITGVLIVFLVRQNRKARATAEKLSQTSRRQESYIGNFIGLYSKYADRLNHLTRLVSTKLATGQGEDLKKLVDSGKYSNQNIEDIHKIFDSAFLDIYPDFVAQVNSLLKPEEAIKLNEHNVLTPELRIYAFIKMGIDESNRIAQILHYSINTVYTYRNKMRNKALQRDSFDEDIKNL